MNSLFRQRVLIKSFDSSKGSKKRIKRESFDATDLIEWYDSYKFGQTVVKSIQLNEIRSSTKEGFYGLVEEIELPKE